MGYGAARYTGVVSDHHAIIQVFERQDADAAASLMGAHVVKAKFELIEKVKNQTLPSGTEVSNSHDRPDEIRTASAKKPAGYLSPY